MKHITLIVGLLCALFFWGASTVVGQPVPPPPDNTDLQQPPASPPAPPAQPVPPATQPASPPAVPAQIPVAPPPPQIAPAPVPPAITPVPPAQPVPPPPDYARNIKMMQDSIDLLKKENDRLKQGRQTAAPPQQVTQRQTSGAPINWGAWITLVLVLVAVVIIWRIISWLRRRATPQPLQPAATVRPARAVVSTAGPAIPPPPPAPGAGPTAPVILLALLFGYATLAHATGKVTKVSPDGFYQGLVNQAVTVTGTDLGNTGSVSFGNPSIGVTLGAVSVTSVATTVSVPTTTPVGRYTLKITNKDNSVVDTTNVFLYVFSRDGANVSAYVEGRLGGRLDDTEKKLGDLEKRMGQLTSADPAARQFLRAYFREAYGGEGNSRYNAYLKKPSTAAAKAALGQGEQIVLTQTVHDRDEAIAKVRDEVAKQFKDLVNAGSGLQHRVEANEQRVASVEQRIATNEEDLTFALETSEGLARAEVKKSFFGGKKPLNLDLASQIAQRLEERRAAAQKQP